MANSKKFASMLAITGGLSLSLGACSEQADSASETGDAMAADAASFADEAGVAEGAAACEGAACAAAEAVEGAACEAAACEAAGDYDSPGTDEGNGPVCEAAE